MGRSLTFALALLVLAPGISAQSEQAEVSAFVDRLLSGLVDEKTVVSFIDEPETTNESNGVRALVFRSGSTVLELYGADRLTLYRSPSPVEITDVRKAVENASSAEEFMRAIDALEQCPNKCQSDINKLLSKIQSFDPS